MRLAAEDMHVALRGQAEVLHGLNLAAGAGELDGCDRPQRRRQDHAAASAGRAARAGAGAASLDGRPLAGWTAQSRTARRLPAARPHRALADAGALRGRTRAPGAPRGGAAEGRAGRPRHRRRARGHGRRPPSPTAPWRSSRAASGRGCWSPAHSRRRRRARRRRADGRPRPGARARAVRALSAARGRRPVGDRGAARPLARRPLRRSRAAPARGRALGAGPPRSVFTPASLAAAYGIRATVAEIAGLPVVLPVEPLP